MREVPQPPDQGRVIQLDLATEVSNHDGNVVGTVLNLWNCYERGSQAQRALYGGRSEPHMYTREDIEAL